MRWRCVIVASSYIYRTSIFSLVTIPCPTTRWICDSGDEAGRGDLLRAGVTTCRHRSIVNSVALRCRTARVNPYSSNLFRCGACVVNALYCLTLKLNTQNSSIFNCTLSHTNVPQVEKPTTLSAGRMLNALLFSDVTNRFFCYKSAAGAGCSPVLWEI